MFCRPLWVGDMVVGCIRKTIYVLGAFYLGASASASAADRYIYNPNGTFSKRGGAGPQSSPVSGFLKSAVGRTDSGNYLWSLRGSVASPLTKSLNAQFDVGYERIETNGAQPSTIFGTAHLFLRDPAKYAAGAFVHVGHNEIAGTSAQSYIGGLEAAAFLGNFTVMAQGGIGTTSTGNNEIYSAKLEGRYYFTDDARVDAQVSHNRSDTGLIDLQTTEVAVTGNYRSSESPVTFFGGYRHEFAKASGGGASVSTDAGLYFVGAKFQFGSSSLKDEERQGALWSPIVGYFD